MRARTNSCGASRKVTTPKRNGRRSVTGRSKKSAAISRSMGALMRAMLA
jgi:hypothetical protein